MTLPARILRKRCAFIVLSADDKNSRQIKTYDNVWFPLLSDEDEDKDEDKDENEDEDEDEDEAQDEDEDDNAAEDEYEDEDKDDNETGGYGAGSQHQAQVAKHVLTSPGTISGEP